MRPEEVDGLLERGLQRGVVGEHEGGEQLGEERRAGPLGGGQELDVVSGSAEHAVAEDDFDEQRAGLPLGLRHEARGRHPRVDVLRRQRLAAVGVEPRHGDRPRLHELGVHPKAHLEVGEYLGRQVLELDGADRGHGVLLRREVNSGLELDRQTDAVRLNDGPRTRSRRGGRKVGGAGHRCGLVA